MRRLSALALGAVFSLPAQVVISQVYGGGNAGAALQNDFVEIFNCRIAWPALHQVILTRAEGAAEGSHLPGGAGRGPHTVLTIRRG